MRIKGTNWYTAASVNMTPIEGSERVFLDKLYGYRLSVKDFSSRELTDYMNDLKQRGINAKLKTSENEHTGIPAGTPYLQVLDEKSALALEKMFLEQGIELPADRYKEYGLEYIKRNSALPQKVVKKSFLDRLLGR